MASSQNIQGGLTGFICMKVKNEREYKLHQLPHIETFHKCCQVGMPDVRILGRTNSSDKLVEISTMKPRSII